MQQSNRSSRKQKLRKKPQATGGGGGTEPYEDSFSWQSRFLPSARHEQQTPSLEGTASFIMDVVLENIITLVKQNPGGIPLKKLAVFYNQEYHENLSLSTLGFDSMVSLISSLDSDLVLEGQIIRHKDHCTDSRLKNEAVATVKAAKQQAVSTQEVLRNVVALVQGHPEGIPLKKVAVVYSQKYKQNLVLASLGHKTVSSLVASLEALVVRKDVVFHQLPKKTEFGKSAENSRPATPQRTSSPRPPVTAPVNHLRVPAPLQPKTKTTLPQDQLYERVIEVITKFKLTAPSMDQLRYHYHQHFGEELPLTQYMSLYDNWQASNHMRAPSQPGISAAPISSVPETPTAGPDPGKDCLKTKPQQLQQTPASDHITASGLTNGQISKFRGVPLRESNAAVFKETYYAQMREVHGANMRAEAEMMEGSEGDPAERRWKRALNSDTVNTLMEDVRREIAAEGELVTKEKVVSRVCRLMDIPSMEAGGIKPWMTQPLKDLQYIMREINMFIECTDAVTSICTLYELGKSLASLKDKQHYEELNLGPLCKLPLIHRMFKIDSNTRDDDIHQIETVDILKHLRVYRKQQTKPRVDLPEFMKYLADHYHCESPYELGIRIHSIGLPISTLIKVSRSEHALLEQGRELIQKELEEETNERLRKIKRSVLEPLQGSSSFLSTGNTDRRKKYASMAAAEVVLEVFTNAAGVFTPRMAKHVQSFLQQVSDNRLARSLFQLAICGGSLAVPHDLVPKDKASKNSDQMNAEEPLATSLPSEAKVKQYIKDSVSAYNSIFTFFHLASLEKKLAKHFQVKDFLSLQQGNFLDFLIKHIQLLQDLVGSALTLSSGTMELAGNGFRPTRQDVFDFINQCGDISYTVPDELSHVESALRLHYRVRDSRDLGYGPLHTLASLVQRQRGLTGGGMSSVFYESALFAKHCKSGAESGCEAVGRLGEMSKAQALASLLSCPLLEDLSEWSQWELIFQPQHKSLKEFIERNAANTALAALEVTPGSLLRITPHTGDKQFAAAATSLDPVGTAGHLVSMVVADGPVNAPVALLANHMECSLAAAVVKGDLSFEEDDASRYGQVAKFLLACLTRIPSRTCQAMLQQVFLEPFSRVVGQTTSKKVLITVAQFDARHLNCLHRLGVLLGITDWVKDYQRKLNPSQNHNGVHHVAPLEQIKSNLIDSQSSSMSALYTSEDEYIEESSQHSSSGASHQSSQQVNGAQEEEEEEELYELRPLPNGEMSDISSEPDEGQDTGTEANIPDAQDEEVAGCSPEVTVDQHRAIIEDIRKSEFGIGVELNAEGQKLMKVHQDRLGRSLDRLSTELYSKDTHFVLELIQNADDNSYPSDGVQPALAFVVETNSITILNNEVGFQEKNIRAICDVGRSTKGKHKYGYIGQKGIGFKSVFKVTDCPEIHSSGFHLRFDKTCGPMGYILPHWVDDERPLDTEMEELNQHSWTTKIYLPLRSESYQTRNLFNDVHPSLLLFLHRLRSITIYNQREKSSVTMTRKDLSHNVLEVEHTEGTERWLVVKTTLQPKKIKEDVESTELALAFQLSSSQTDSDITQQPQKQPVFAYLPLRSFGFRFIIQGDFDIPSSREDVDRDSSWNQWLRSEIPQLFLQAMSVFTEHPEFRGLKGLCRFLHFIPLPDEVLDFFKPVAGQILQLLKGEAFLPTLSTDGKVVKKLPSQVAICQDAVIRDVIGGDELERHLSLSYLHPDVAKAPPTSLLAHLGVRYLRGSDVSTVTTAMAKELVRAKGIHSGDGLRQLARLLVCNFRAMEHGYEDADSVLSSLRGLPIIPLADGRVVALSEEGVFFPVEEAQTSRKKSPTEALSALYKDVNVVLPDLLGCVESLESQQVRELLKRLGVHEMQPQELLEQHIYPAIRSNKWKNKPEDVVVSYLVFIKQHSTSRQEYVDIAVPVLTSRGLLCPASERVHFSTEYDNMDLPKCFPGCDWVLLSPCYVATDGDVAGWRELFSKLGVRDGLVIRKERQTLTAKDLESSPWSVESKTWNLIPGEGCELEDYPCEEFQALATAQLPGSLLHRQRENLLQLLASNWDTGHRYSQYLTAQVLGSDGRENRRTKSSFQHYLRSLQWLPAYRPLEGDQVERHFLLPSAVYLSSRDVHSLLGNHVCYVDISPSQFSRDLGMRHSVSVEDLINYLKKWCIKPAADPQEQRPVEDEPEGAAFTSTVEHIHQVYSYLCMNCSQSHLKELFQHNPAVFIEYNRRDGNWCSGRFYHLKEVCWADPTAMFQRYKQLIRAPDCPIQKPNVLAPFYKQLDGMRDFFLNLLNVDRSPNMNQYVGLLELICESSPIPTAEVLQDVSVLFARLALKCKSPTSGELQDSSPESKLDHSYCSTLKGMVSDKKVFPTKDNKWVSLARKPMIPNSKELEKVFKQHKEICLLHLPPAERRPGPKNKTGNYGQSDRGDTTPAFSEDDRSLFLKICGIRPLSECVRTQAQTENLRPSPTVQDTVRTLVPYIQRFLWHHDELSTVYAELLEINIGERIKTLSYTQVGKLYIHYQLEVGDRKEVAMQDIPCLLKDNKELCIQKDHISDTQEICSELVKLFCTEQSHRKELVLFLRGLITSLHDPRALQRFLRKEDVGELPSGEEAWEVPIADFTLERVLSRSNSAVLSTEEQSRPTPEDGEGGLACWPPRAPVSNTGAARKARSDSTVVDAVLKMWPPPAPPKDPEPEKDVLDRASSQPGPSSSSGSTDVSQPPRAKRPLEQASTQRSHPAQPNDATESPDPPEPQQKQRQTTESNQPPTAGEETAAAARPPSGQPAEAASSPPPPNSLAVPDAVVLSGVFQGSAAAADSLRPLNLDFPYLSPQTTLEDLELHCQRPTTVVLSDEPMELTAIGLWGEQLVNSFLCDWRDGADPGRPTQVLWCNGSGESGKPYDFRVSFESSGVLYVEVKATVKHDRSFIHLSANELDFALQEKERYHVFRVYGAGDAQNVRLCRIQNLAQHLHTKDLALYLFV